MSSLIAPVYWVWDLGTFAGENRLPPGQQHFAVTKSISTSSRIQDEEIVLDAGVTARQWPESSQLEAELRRKAAVLNQQSFDEHLRGRKFTRYETSWYIALDPVEADRLAGIDNTPAERVRVTPDIEILHCDGSHILWSDGRTTERSGPRLPAGGSVSKTAAMLIGNTRLQKAWRPDAWRKLAGVQSVDRETLVRFDDRWQGIGAHGSDEYTLDRLTTDTGLVLYELHQAGGAMGEDGDAWEYTYLYESELEARAAYRKEIILVLVESLSQAVRRIEEGLWVRVAQAWPLEASWAKANFDVELPLQAELAEVLKQHEAYEAQFADMEDADEIEAKADSPVLPVKYPVVDEHGWAMYLKGFAKAL